MGRIKGRRNEKIIKRKKEIIMIATYLVIVEKGYSSITIKDIANKANVSPGLLFYYFKSKEDIFIETLKWVNSRILKRLRKKLIGIDDPVEKMRIRIEDSFLSIKENRRFYLFYLDFLREAVRDDKFFESHKEFQRLALEKSIEIIKEGKERKVFRDSITIAKASKMIKSIIDGLILQWLFDKPETFESYKRLACETILYYLVKDKTKLDKYLKVDE